MTDTITIRSPWTMLPLEVADEYIEYLQKRINSNHPLHGKDIFPSCRREDTDDLVVQFDIDDDGTYAIVYFHETQIFGKKKMPKVELIASRSELKKRFEQDYLAVIEAGNP